MKRYRVLLLLSLWPLLQGCAAKQEITHVDVFTSGQDGYHTYRIPAVETAPDGSLLVFTEARKYNRHDPGTHGNDIDLVYKRSTDAGRTWSEMMVLDDPGERWSSCNPVTPAGSVRRPGVAVSQPDQAGPQQWERQGRDRRRPGLGTLQPGQRAHLVGAHGPHRDRPRRRALGRLFLRSGGRGPERQGAPDRSGLPDDWQERRSARAQRLDGRSSSTATTTERPGSGASWHPPPLARTNWSSWPTATS